MTPPVQNAGPTSGRVGDIMGISEVALVAVANTRAALMWIDDIDMHVRRNLPTYEATHVCTQIRKKI